MGLSCLLLLFLLSDSSKGLVKRMLQAQAWLDLHYEGIPVSPSQLPPNQVFAGRSAYNGGKPEGVSGVGRVVPTIWLSSSFLSAGLSVWEAAFLLDVGEGKKNQLPKVSQ